MKKKTFGIFILLLFMVILKTGIAQEIQIPIDKQGKIEYIDAKLEQKLGLFPQYANFQEARLFLIPDTSFVLEISYRPEGKLLKVRLPLSKEEVKNLQQKVTERIKQKTPQITVDQEGRTKLLRGIMTLSLGYYGWAVPVALNIDDGKLGVALYMLTSGAGFYIPFSATKHAQVTDAAATLSIYGGVRGILHGFFLANLLNDDPSGDAMIASGIVVSIAEAISFFQYANKSNITAGTAETMGIGGDVGLLLGATAASLAELEYQAANGAMLIGSGIGLWGGKMLANSQPYTRGDAYVLGATALLGAYVPLALVDMADPKNDKAYSTAMMIGTIAGMGLGNKLVKGKDFTTGQGNLIRLSEFAGGLLGLGFAYLFSPADDFSSSIFLTSSAVGATAGFWLMYRSFSRQAQTSNSNFSCDVNIVPVGLLSLAQRGKIGKASRYPIPLFNINFRF